MRFAHRLRHSIALVGLAASTGCTVDRAFWADDNVIRARAKRNTEAQASYRGISDRDPRAKIAIVEFSDTQGLHAPAERENTLRLIRGEPKPGLIVMYLHGWHNNADPSFQGDPTDPAAKQKDLLRLDRVVTDLARARDGPVLGIYLGWRGEVTKVKVIRYLTLPNRRAVARDIGRSDALVNLIAAVSDAAHDGRIPFVAVGHSLGAVMLQKVAERAICEHRSTPNVYLLLESAETSSEAERGFQKINDIYRQREERCPTRIIAPKVIAFTSETDLAVKLLNPLNSAVHLRGLEPSLGFDPKLQTHNVVATEYAQTSANSLREAIHRSEQSTLDPTLWIPETPGQAAAEQYRARQYRLVANSTGAKSPGFWNILVRKQLIANHADILNKDALAAYASFIGRSVPQEEYRDLREFLQQWRDNTRHRGQTGSGEEVYGPRGRDYFEGLLARIKYNPETVSLMLHELEACDLVGEAHDGVPPNSAWQLRYIRELLSVLKWANEPGMGWTTNNRTRIAALLGSPIVRQALDRASDLPSRPQRRDYQTQSHRALKKFEQMVRGFATR